MICILTPLSLKLQEENARNSVHFVFIHNFVIILLWNPLLYRVQFPKFKALEKPKKEGYQLIIQVD